VLCRGGRLVRPAAKRRQNRMQRNPPKFISP
jgi:hypothetical protein